MGNLNKTTYVDHQTVITADNLNAIQDSVIQNTSYTTCSTAANTAAKTVTLTNFVLTTGSAVKVKFTNTNTAANPTLNINSTGAKPIMQYGTTAAGTTATESWDDGAVVELVYDGTNWVMQGRNTIDAVSKANGGTFKGNITVDRSDGTTSAQGYSTIFLGNNIPTGTANNSMGQVCLYSANSTYYANLHASGSLTANRQFALPDAGGTIALTNNPTDITVDRADGTTSAQGWSSVLIGNNKATGTAGNSAGDLQIYGRTSYKTEFIPMPNSPTANRIIYIPDASGTIALQESTQTLTLTRTENSYVTAEQFNRLRAYKRNGLLFLGFNLATNSFTTSDSVEIGKISGWNTPTDALVCIPAQGDGTKTLLLQVTWNGIIKIYSSTGTGGSWFRTDVCMPENT